MFSVQEGSEVGPLPHGVWGFDMVTSSDAKAANQNYKKALKSEKARIR